MLKLFNALVLELTFVCKAPETNNPNDEAEAEANILFAPIYRHEEEYLL
jgi:hypothetical protein